MKTVLVFGTFDVIHPGHRWFLRQAGALGDKVIAVVSRDDFVREWKGRPPLSDEEARIASLKASGLVDDAILADEQIRTYGVVESIQPDIICLGHDQKALKDDLESYLLSDRRDRYPLIKVLPPWRRWIYSSTLRNRGLGSAAQIFGKGNLWTLYGLMVLAMMAFGFSWVSGKRLSLSAGPGTLAFIRFLVTGLCFLPFLFIRRDTMPTADRRGWIWTAFASLCIVSYNLLFFLGLDAGLAGKGGLIVTTMNPLFTFLVASLLSRKLPRGLGILGLVIGIGAGVVLIEPWSFTESELLDSGNILFMLAALAWSSLTLSAKKAQGFLGFRRFNFALYLFAGLVTLPFAIREAGPRFLGNYGMDFWLDMLFISAVVGAFGTGMYFIASMRLGPARGSAFTYLVPVSAIGFTWTILGEVPHPATIAGGIAAVSAVILINVNTSVRG